MGDGFLSLSFTELVILAFLAFLLLKPNEYYALGSWVGKYLLQLINSDFWKFFQKLTRDVRGLPLRMMRESAQEEGLSGLRTSEARHASTSPERQPPSPPKQPSANQPSSPMEGAPTDE
jgi:hypothetical protein